MTAWCEDCALWHDPTGDCVESACRPTGDETMTEFEYRDATDAELEGTVGGGASAGAALKIGLTKLARPLPASRVRLFRGPLAEGRPAAAPAAPQGCAGGRCSV